MNFFSEIVFEPTSKKTNYINRERYDIGMYIEAYSWETDNKMCGKIMSIKYHKDEALTEYELDSGYTVFECEISNIDIEVGDYIKGFCPVLQTNVEGKVEFIYKDTPAKKGHLYRTNNGGCLYGCEVTKVVKEEI